jgi:phosphoribosylpyrophosphate synthetase
VFSGGALDRLSAQDAIPEIVSADTIPVNRP